MLFLKKKLLFFLRKHSLEIYQADPALKEVLEFPPEVVKYLEIKNSAEFETLITQFIAKLSLPKRRVIIMLGSDLIFQKTVPLGTAIDLVKTVESFLKSLPIESDKVTCIDLEKDKEWLLLAADNSLYLKLKEILEKLGFKVEAVISSIVFPTTPENSGFTPANANLIFKDKKLISSNNFLKLSRFSEGAIGIIRKQDKTDSFVKKIIIVLTAGVLVIVSVYLYTVIYTYNATYIQNIPNRAVKHLSTHATPSALIEAKEATQSASDSASKAVSKSDLRVQIINGSGKAGQEDRLKDILKKIGFKNFSTSNADVVGAYETIVIFSKRVSKEIRNELIDQLQPRFIKISQQSDTDSLKYDIMITVGL